MKGILLKENLKVKEIILLKKVVIILANLKMVINMGKELIIIKMVQFYMKEIMLMMIMKDMVD